MFILFFLSFFTFNTEVYLFLVHLQPDKEFFPSCVINRQAARKILNNSSRVMLKYASDVIVRVSLDMQLDNSAAKHEQEQRYAEKKS